jgi:GNAT superfamily N-acetyltransferase
MSFTVRPISATVTLDLRHAILRAGLPRETAIFPGDDAPSSQHFGAFMNERLVGVATIHYVPLPDPLVLERSAYQVRGMATVEEVRGQGVGSALLVACIAAAKAAGVPWIWCNARTPAAGFYSHHGFKVQGEVFDIPTAGPHYRMRRALCAPAQDLGEC